MFISTIAFGKTYPLNYTPKGSIIQLNFDSCTFYTDSTSLFTAYESICTVIIHGKKCRFVITYDDFCKTMRNAIQNKDTLKLDLKRNNQTDTSITSFFFPPIVKELIEMNKVQLYSANEKCFLSSVKIKTKTRKRRSLQIKRITTKKADHFLLAYKIEEQMWFD